MITGQNTATEHDIIPREKSQPSKITEKLLSKQLLTFRYKNGNRKTMSHLQKLELTTNLTPNYHDYYS